MCGQPTLDRAVRSCNPKARWVHKILRMKTTKELATVAMEQLDKVKGGYVHIPTETLPPEIAKKLKNVRT